MKSRSILVHFILEINQILILIIERMILKRSVHVCQNEWGKAYSKKKLWDPLSYAGAIKQSNICILIQHKKLTSV